MLLERAPERRNPHATYCLLPSALLATQVYCGFVCHEACFLRAEHLSVVWPKHGGCVEDDVAPGCGLLTVELETDATSSCPKSMSGMTSSTVVLVSDSSSESTVSPSEAATRAAAPVMCESSAERCKGDGYIGSKLFTQERVKLLQPSSSSCKGQSWPAALDSGRRC